MLTVSKLFSFMTDFISLTERNISTRADKRMTKTCFHTIMQKINVYRTSAELLFTSEFHSINSDMKLRTLAGNRS